MILPRLLSILLLFATTAFGRPTIVVDAGHGGHDRGGMPGQRIPEKGYALDVSRRLEEVLRRSGFRTVMTRRGDYFVPLSDRCAIANRHPNGVFVSIHFNGAPNFDASGIETYYYSGRQSAALASAIQQRVVRATGSPNRWVRSRGLHVLRNTRIPAVLCELGFLTNRGESSRIASAAYRQRLAETIAAAIRSRY